MGTVVLTNGVFDWFHYGHLMYLQKAREFGDTLIVSVTLDEFVNKGPGRPYFKLHQRVAMLRALAIVDDVRPVKCPEDAIRAVRPNVYVKGAEYKGLLREQALVEALGGRVEFTHHPEGSFIRSTSIIQQYKNAQDLADKS